MPLLNYCTSWQHAGRLEYLRRAMKMNLRQFNQTLHIGLGVILLGGFILFDQTHDSFWAARNAGVSGVVSVGTDVLEACSSATLLLFHVPLLKFNYSYTTATSTITRTGAVMLCC